MALASPFSRIPDLSDNDLAEVRRGQVPIRMESVRSASGKAAGRGWGAIAIQRPLSDVWKTLARCDDRAEYMPRLLTIDILEQSANRIRLKQTVDATIKTAYSTLLFELHPEEHRISWTLDKSAADNSVVDVEGDYRLAELAQEQTLVVYRTFIDSGLYVPQLVQSHMQKRAIPELLNAIKRRVESGGRWKK